MRLVDQNPILTPLLNEAKKLGVAQEFIHRVLDIGDPGAVPEANELSLGRRSQKKKPPSVLSGLMEPLSSRETEVLALMAEGLSNADIAARLYLSPNTLKAHSQNIFGKMGVHNRVQAVNKARDLKLIKLL